MGKRRALAWTSAVVLLLLLWATRLPALDALPLHLDEGIHLTRAVEVWHLHPFWDISDGKIVNHWLIAAFYPQNAPVFVGRVATALMALLGLAGGYALARSRFGAPAGMLAGALWIAAPYAFFFERLALPDAQIGALVALTLWASVRLARRGRTRDAVKPAWRSRWRCCSSSRRRPLCSPWSSSWRRWGARPGSSASGTWG
ncbi:MAG: glycosyltransferase family 39 protein [Anaerolineae bacterium]|nr:glycosyltransferase family 39 protein [Anaerolineae bacterium]